MTDNTEYGSLPPEQEAARRAAFDRWLAAHDEQGRREVAAQAWDEGWQCGNDYALDSPTHYAAGPWANPYRSGSEGNKQ